MSPGLRCLLASVVRPELALAALTLGAGVSAYLGIAARGGQTVAIGAVQTTVGDLQA